MEQRKNNLQGIASAQGLDKCKLLETTITPARLWNLDCLSIPRTLILAYKKTRRDGLTEGVAQLRGRWLSQFVVKMLGLLLLANAPVALGQENFDIVEVLMRPNG